MTLSARLSVGFAVLAAFLSFAGFAYANPSFFGNGVSTNSAASTTPAYLTAGVSTSTTPTFNAYTQTASGGATSKSDNALLVIQLTASSSNTVLNLAVEYSVDGIDWYRNFVIDPLQTSTSSITVALNTPYSIQQKFASSTVGGIGLTNANSTVGKSAIMVPTPAQYTRVVASLTGGNGAVWMNLVPIKQR